MKTFATTKSVEIKIILFTLTLISLLLLLSLFYIHTILAIVIVSATFILVLSSVLYCNSISLSKIVFTYDSVVLYKKQHPEIIYYSDVLEVALIDNVDLATCDGTNGICGYHGTLDNGWKILINDTKKMLKIVTTDAVYIISCSRRKKFIAELVRRRNFQ